MKRHRDNRHAGGFVRVMLCAVVGVMALPAVLAAADPEDDLKAAMMRDLGLDAAQLEHRQGAELLATEQDQILRGVLDDVYAGSWIDQATLELVVAVTDPVAVAAVESVGARAVIHKHSLTELDRVKDALDRMQQERSDLPYVAWFVDVQGNRLLVEALETNARSSQVLQEQLRAPAGTVEVVTVTERPQTLNTYYAGTGYRKGGGLTCSAGFAVNGGFVTAGHCGTVGQAVTNAANSTVGTFAGSTFPGSDMAWVSLNASANAQPHVTTYGGANLPVKGSTPAPIGGIVCRSGFATGFQCGTVQALNASVSYSQGTVYGLTRTSACAWGGDSGGPFISASGHAQGVTSGGITAYCQIYFQPIAPILSAYSKTLTLGSGATPGGSAPVITSFNCPVFWASGAGQYMCEVNYTSNGPAGVAWFSGGWFTGSTGSNLWGTCWRNQNVSVQVRVSNRHGTTTRNATFLCPVNQIP